MFERLGRIVIRYRWPVIAAWVALALGVALFAPTLATAGTASDVAFLPADAPALVAERAFATHFPQPGAAGAGVLVFYDAAGLSAADKAYAGDLATWLRSPAAPAQVGGVTSVFDQPDLERVLVSQDGTTMLMRLDFTSEPSSDAANQAVDQVRAHIAGTARPAPLDVALTGQAAIGRDLIGAIIESVDKTTLAAILLVVLVLLLIYRSPVAASIPLVTIGVAYVITRGALGLLAEAGMKLSSMADAFVVVLIFGAGTDYALFLFSRYREEVAGRAGTEGGAAGIATVARIGPVITASASTVIIATLGMVIARFQLTKTLGPAMAVGVALALLASLTLTPALLSLPGKYLFWPLHARLGDGGRPSRWARIAALITAHPGRAAVLVTALLLLPYLALPQFTRSYDILSELPLTLESRHGFEVLKQHFDQGELLPITVGLAGNADLQSPAGLAHLAQMDATLAAIPGVARVRSVVHPTGGADPALDQQLQAPDQVRRLAQQLQQNLATPGTGVLTATLVQANTQLADLRGYLADLGAAFPAVQAGSTYAGSQAALAGLQTQLDQAIAGTQVYTQLQRLAAQTGALGAAATPAPQPTATATSGDTTQTLALLQTYLHDLAAAFPEVQTDPGFQQALTATGQLQQQLAQVRQQSQVGAQLTLLATRLAGLETLLASPEAATATPQPGQPSAADQVAIVEGYLRELGPAYREVQSNPSYGEALDLAGRIHQALDQIAAGRARGIAVPTQQAEQIRLQLHAQAQTLRADLGRLAASFAGRDAPFSPATLAQTDQGRQQRAALQQAATTLQTGLTTLAARFAGGDAPFLPDSLRALQAGAGTADAIPQATTRLAAALGDLAATLPPDAYFLPASALQRDPRLATLLTTFLAPDHTATQIQVLVAGQPYSAAAIATVNQVEATAGAAAAPLGLTAYTTGPIAQVRDIHTMVDDDFGRVTALVVGGVFLVFVVLLASLAAPLYLVATVLLSFGTTLGLMTLIFQGLLGQDGVTYFVPTVIFVLLVALGADYNIFLISRVWEETAARENVREGVRHASAYTGGVITSAGIILAGTFAALTVAPLQSLFQVGAAVAVGVLVDTFIVRALLVPALAALVGRWNWWPARRPVGPGGLHAGGIRPAGPSAPGHPVGPRH